MDLYTQIKNRPLGELSYAAIDFESAGAAPGETDQAVQIGIVKVPNLLHGVEEHYCHYLAATRPIHWRAAKVHGIKDADLEGSKPLLHHWVEIKQLLSHSIVLGHNLGTERKFLNSFPAHNFGPWLDTLKLARHVLPTATDYSLGALCCALGLEEEIQAACPAQSWHNAHFDAYASLALLRFVVKELQLEASPLHCLKFAIQAN